MSVSRLESSLVLSLALRVADRVAGGVEVAVLLLDFFADPATGRRNSVGSGRRGARGNGVAEISLACSCILAAVERACGGVEVATLLTFADATPDRRYLVGSGGRGAGGRWFGDSSSIDSCILAVAERVVGGSNEDDVLKLLRRVVGSDFRGFSVEVLACLGGGLAEPISSPR